MVGLHCCTLAFSSCCEQVYSSLLAQASYCSGFSCCRAQVLGLVVFSTCGSQALKHQLSTCGAQTWFLRGMWDLPRPRIKPVSSAFAGRFLTTEPPGETPFLFLKCTHVLNHQVVTLCDPMDCSLPDSSVHGIFPGKRTRVGCHSLFQGIFLTQGSNTSPALAGRFFTSQPSGKC